MKIFVTHSRCQKILQVCLYASSSSERKGRSKPEKSPLSLLDFFLPLCYYLQNEFNSMYCSVPEYYIIDIMWYFFRTTTLYH